MKRLLLVGGGHAHLAVLDALARTPLPGWEALLLTPEPVALYSGMLPGWVAGHYGLAQCGIPLQPLADAAGVQLLEDAVVHLDADARRITTAGGRVLGYDLLSLDPGSVPATQGIAGAATHAQPIRPLAGFAAHWQALCTRLAATADRQDLVVLGAGAGGVEMAFALRHRAQREGWAQVHVHLVGAGAEPLASARPPLRRRVGQHLQRRGIHWHGGRRAVAVQAGALQLDDGQALPADACWLLTGPAPHGWLRTSGLGCDAAGFVQVTATLQSRTHANVFAAGDTAALPAPARRSGVYAVRAGPWLARNLLAQANGQPLVDWQAQSRALYLLSTGDRRAIVEWGPFSAAGRWAWWLKDAIDRRHVARWQRRG